MDLSQLSTKELEKKVLARKAWLIKIVDFVEKIVLEHGECLAYKEHSAHTFSKHELKDVRGFTFSTEGSFSMFGGENIRIWYCPPRKKDEPNKEVLYLEWWSRDDIHVKTCVDEKTWWPAFERLMESAHKIFPTPAQKKQQREKAEKEKEKQAEEAIVRKKLLEQAEKIQL